MQKLRYYEIDVLRGLGILAIILIHVSAYFLKDPLAKFVWDYSQFTVQTFVFVSGYLFFLKNPLENRKTFWSYLKKRARRLLIPYWSFLVFYFAIIAVFSLGTLTPEFFIRWLTLTTTGNELNWFVVLFLQFVILLPLLSYWAKNRKWLFYLYSLFALSSSLLLLGYNIPLNYKLTMWLPWSLILIVSWYTARYEKRRWFYPVAIVGSFFIFFVLRYRLQILDHSLSFYDNKYPPNLYFLSYGIWVTLLLLWLSGRGVFSAKWFQKSITFLGVHSYSIFFVHFLIIFLLASLLNLGSYPWWQIFFLVLGLTLAVQVVLNAGRRFISSRY